MRVFSATVASDGQYQLGEGPLWDEARGFYYDILDVGGRPQHVRVRSMVGLLPLCATTVIEPWQRERVPRVGKRMFERMRRMPELRESVHATGPGHFGYGERGMAALLRDVRRWDRMDIHLPRCLNMGGDIIVEKRS